MFIIYRMNILGNLFLLTRQQKYWIAINHTYEIVVRIKTEENSTKALYLNMKRRCENMGCKGGKKKGGKGKGGK